MAQSRPTLLRRQRRISRLLTSLLAPFCGWSQAQTAAPPTAPLPPGVLPQGGQVRVGLGTFSQTGNLLLIHQQTSRLGIDWDSFNIGLDAAVQFRQPGKSSIALNRITGHEATRIFGQLQANGQVFLTNPYGVLFAPGSKVDVGGLVATTLDLSQADFAAGNLSFSGDSTGAVVNEGDITAEAGGYLALLAPAVDNRGSLTVDAGSVVLASGRAATVSVSGHGLISAVIDAGVGGGAVLNSGIVQADGGTVRLTAVSAQALAQSLVNNTGLVRADGLEDRAGEIWITGDRVVSSGTLQARGAGRIDGGHITVQGGMSEGSLALSGAVTATAEQGRGGRVDTSAAQVSIALGTRVDTRSGSGANGLWRIDPTDFTVSAGSGPAAGSGIGAETLAANLDIGNVELATLPDGDEAGDIHVNADVTWSASNLLTLTAARHVLVNADITATGAAAGLVVNPGVEGALTLAAGARVRLPGANSTFTLSGNAYTMIRSLADLQAIDGDATALAGRYALADDLDASGTAVDGFSPIGNESTTSISDANTFRGQFQGLGNAINGLVIDAPSSNATGLFASVQNARIENLRLTGGSVAGSQSVGALAGVVNGTTVIDNVHASLSVSAVDDSSSGVRAGGLVGENSDTNSATYSRSSAAGDVTADTNTSVAYVGGLAGITARGTLSDVAASGQVTATLRAGSTNDSSFYVGGLVGLTSSVVSDASASGDVAGGSQTGGLVGRYTPVSGGSISNSQASGDVSGSDVAGGLVGMASPGGSGAGGITDSTASGNVASTGSAAGGLVGRYDLTAAIERVSASGEVIGGTYAGGLVGYVTSTAAIDTATTTGTAVVGERFVGGLVGYHGTGTISNASAVADVVATSTSGVNVGGLAGRTGGSVSIATAGGNVTASNASGQAYAGGLIGSAEGGASSSITDVGAGGTVTVASNSSTTRVGGLIGSAGIGNITNAVAVGAVSGGQYTGGLVGYYATSSGTVSDSTASGSVSGFGDAGGLIGNASGTGTITASSASGAVTSTASSYYSVGGVVGVTTLSGGVSDVQASGAVSGGFYTGGVIGNHANGSLSGLTTTITEISGVGWVGGLVGYSTNAAISGLDSIIHVTHTGTSGGAGGVVGYLSGSITGSSASGAVTATGTGNIDVGGLVGEVSGGGISGSSASGAVSGGNATGGLVGRFAATGGSLLSSSGATGDVTGAGSAGGLVGVFTGTGGVSNASATGQVISTGAESGSNYVGGAVGQYGGSVGPVGLTAEGDVSGGQMTGGVIGYLSSGSVALPEDSVVSVVPTGHTKTVTGPRWVGGLIGYSDSTGLASNLGYSGIVEATGSSGAAGGLFGRSYGAVANSSTSGTVSGLGDVGGLVGRAQGSGGFTDVASIATVTNGGSNGAVGGLVGYYNHGGTLLRGNASGNVTGGAETGGLVGWASTNTAGAGLESSGATGDVTASGGAYVGGLVGRYDMPGTMTAVTASGVVVGGSNSTGGLVGYFNSSAALSDATYSGGTVTGNTGSIGGLVGYADAGAIAGVNATATVRATGAGSVNIGGLVGRTAGTLADVSASGDVIAEGATGTVAAGGLVGRKEGSSDITDGSATGTVSVASSSTGYVGGLVGYLSGGGIERGLAIGDVTGGLYTGGLAGYFSPSTGSITDSEASGDVSGRGDVGGLVGYANGTGGIASSQATGTVTSSDTGSYSVGGAVGYFGMSGKLAGVTSTGNVSGGGYTGGVVGYHYSTAVLDDVSTTATTVTGATWVGGIVGFSRAASITGLNANAAVVQTGTSSGGVGGLAGYSSGAIDNSAATGTVTGNSGSSGDVGGLVGQMQGGITDSAASGAVSGGSGDVGGLAGYVSGAVSNSTASGTVSGGNGYIGGLIGRHVTGTLSQLTATGNVSGGASSIVGGLVGYDSSGGDAENLRAEGDVVAGNAGGGLFGYWYYGTTLADSQATGSVTSAGVAGGLVGYAYDNATGIVNSSASGTVRGSTYVGGLVGQAYYTSIDQGQATGNVTAVTGNGSTVYVGGLVGSYYHYTAGEGVRDSSASGNVLADANSSRAGGLVGEFSSGSLERSIATGNVVAQDSSGGGSTSHYAGGLVGNFSAYTATVFADNEATGDVTSAGHAGGLVAYYSGYPSAAAPTNVSASGHVTGTDFVGGLFGRLLYTGLINGSATGDVVNTGTSGATGGLIGQQYRYYEGSSITNSRATGHVSGGYYAGGLIGEATDYYYYASGSSFGILASQASGDVSGAYTAGGLVGRYFGGYGSGSGSGVPTDLGIQDSSASGNVQATYIAGGLVGTMASYGGVVGSRASGHVTVAPAGTGARAGGLIGELSAYSGPAGDGRIQQSTASGDVTLAAGSGPASSDIYSELFFGGLVGWISGAGADTVTVSDSYATGAVSVLSDGGRVRAGGLVGSTDGSIEHTYAIGGVSGLGYEPSRLVGGLVGEVRVGGTTTTASYWAVDSSGQAESAAGTASTLAAMRDPATFDGWDIATAGGTESIWRQYAGQTLPLLRRFLTPLTVTLGDVSREYDGTAGLGSGMLDFGGVIIDNPGAIIVDGNAVDVGTYDIDTSNLASTQAGYDLNISGLATLTITPRTLTLTGLVLDKVYDGTTTATLASSPAFGNLVSGEDLQFVPGNGFAAAFADRNAGVDKTVVLAGSYGIADGTVGKATNYALSGTATATITPKPITVGDITAVDRVYDGTTVVAVNAASGTLSGVISGDSVAFDAAAVTSGTIPIKNVGTHPVTVLGAALTGTDAGNYSIAGLDAITVQITPKALTLDGLVAYDREYNAGTYVSINTSGATLTGVVAGDLVLPQTSGVYGQTADKNVGVGKAVDIFGAGLRGPDALNYTMTPGAVTVDISPYQLTVYLAHQGSSSRVYDGTTSAATYWPTYWYYGDDLTVNADSIGYADKNVAYNGSGQVVSKTITASGLTLSGADASNYALQNSSATLQGTITPKALTVTGVAAVDRVYDGTVNVQVDIGSAAIDTAGVVSGDTVSVMVPGSGSVTGLMADKNVGDAKAVTVPGLSLAGTDAGNYSITGTGGGVTVNITPRDLTATYVGQNKVYDGSAYAVVQGTLDAVVDGDDVSQYVNYYYCSYYYGGCAVFVDAGGTAANYTANRHAGTDKTIVVTYNYLYGTDAANYRLLNSTGLATPADVTPKPVSLSYAGDTRVYDGTTDATVTLNRSASGLYSGDTLEVTQSAVFSGDGAKNVGSGKAIAVSGIVLAGEHAGNYTLLSDTTSTTGTITARPVVVSGIVAASRAYDGTTTVSVSAPGDVGSSGFVDGDTVSVVLPSGGLTTGTIAAPDVGTAKPVTVTGLTLDGADAANYLIDPSASGITVDITPLALTATFAALQKIYDGRTEATVVSTTAGIIDGDVLTFTQVANFTGSGAKNVGTDKPITVSDIRLSGSDAGNYTLASATAQTTGEIVPKTVAPLYTGGSRIYDGVANHAAPVTGDSLGFINGDDVRLAETARFSGDGSAGTGKAVAVSDITIVGTDAANYTLSSSTASTTATVTPRPIRVSGVTAVDRVYDGTTTVQVNVNNATVDTSTVIAGDDVDIALPPGGISSGTMADRFVGNNKTVTISGAALTGADAGNYEIVGASGLAVDISPLAITAVYAAADKVYDGTASASITASSAELLAVDIGGVAVLASGVFSDGKQVGNDKTVAVSGGFLSGAFAGNYTLVNNSGSVTASITPRPLTVSYIGGTRVYDGTVDAPVTGSLGNRIGGDVLTLTQTAVFTGDGARNVGEAKPIAITGIVLGGADAGNYLLPDDTASASASGSITPRPVVVEGLSGVQAVDRVYDGTLLVDVNVPAGIAGTPRAGDLIAGDDVILSLPSAGIVTGRMADRHAGTDKPVLVDGLGLSGADAGNYVITAASGVTVDITPLTISAAYAGIDRVYDGTTNAPVAVTLSGVLSGDVLSGTASGLFTDGKNVGVDKPVAVSGGALIGMDAGNYRLDNTSGSTTASVTARSVTAVYVGGTRVYDGTTTAPVTGSVDGMVAGDSLALSQTAAFSDGKNVGNDKPVAIGDITLSGADAGNYLLTTDAASTTASVTPRPVVIEGLTVSAEGREYDGTTTVTVQVTAVSGAGPRAGDLIAGDDVAVLVPPSGATTGQMADKHAGTGKAIVVDGLGLAGADAANYEVVGTSGLTVDIAPRTLTVGWTGVSRVYDGTDVAQATGIGDRVVDGDDLFIAGTGVFEAGRNAGTALVVRVDASVLTGADAGNYVLTNPTGTATADITPKLLAVTYSGGSRVYDGTVQAPVSGLLDGLIDGDSVTLSQTAVFTGGGAKNVGTGKTVAITGIALQGADAGNYTADVATADTTADITPRPVVLEGLTASATSREYDGTTTVVVDLVAASGVVPRDGDLIAGDDVGVVVPDTGSTTGLMADRHVGTGKAVVIDGLLLTGADAGNYRIDGVQGVTVDITPRTLTATWVGVDKVYDGTDVGTAIGSGDRTVAGDDLVLTASGTYVAGRNAGTGLALTVHDGQLGGADAGNYLLLNPQGTAIASILPRTVTAVYAGVDKVYDGTAAAQVNGTLDGAIDGDVLTLTQNAVFTEGRNVGTGKTVSVGGITLAGGDAGNYVLADTSASTTASITPRPLTVTGLGGLTAVNRDYDGTQVVALTGTLGGTAGLNGLITGDDVSLGVGGDTPTQGFMLDKNAGVDKGVVIEGLSLSGADALNYVLAETLGLTVTITPRTLTASGIVAINRVYDGTTLVALDTTAAALSGVVSGDDLRLRLDGATATLADKHAGVNRAVSLSGSALEGDDAGNYSLVAGADLRVTITPRALQATATAAGKVYDGTTTASVTVSDDRLDGDALILGTSAAFASAGAGVGKTVNVGFTLAGDDAGDYVLSAETLALTADIERRALLLTAPDLAKIYGQAIVLNGTEFTADGLVTGETIGSVQFASAGLAASAAAGNYTLTIGSAQGGSFDPANYVLSYRAAALLVNPRPLTLTALLQSKVYGELFSFDSGDYTIGGEGLANGETLGQVDLASAGSAARAGVGVYDITIGNAGGGTFSAANYAITYEGSAMTVAPRPLTVATQSVVRFADEPNPTSFGYALGGAGLASGDVLAGVLQPVPAGSATAAGGSIFELRPTGLNFSSGSAANYQVTYVSGLLIVLPTPPRIDDPDGGTTGGDTQFAIVLDPETLARAEEALRRNSASQASSGGAPGAGGGAGAGSPAELDAEAAALIAALLRGETQQVSLPVLLRLPLLSFDPTLRRLMLSAVTTP